MKLFPISIFILIILTISRGVAQTDSLQKHWSLGINTYYGALFKMRAHDPLLQFSHLSGIELTGQQQTNGTKYWHQLYGYPEIQFGVGFYDYGVPKTYGQSYIAHVGLGFLLADQLKFSFGSGIVYTNRIYDKDKNPENRAISTTLSFGLLANLTYTIPLNNSFSFQTQISFRHISNGRIKIPNNGMNVPLLGIGVNYHPHDKEPVKIKKEIPKVDKKLHYQLSFARGWKNVMGYDPTKNPVNLLSFYISKNISPINAFTIGLDGWYDHSTYHELWLKHSAKPDESMDIDNRRLAFTLGNIFYMGDFEFLFQMARYIYLPYKFYSSYYQRYGIHYRCLENAFLNVSLKAYKGKADLLEFGVGIGI